MNRFLLIAFMAIAAACGGRQSMASKSAAAYRDAVARGVNVGAGEHTHDEHGKAGHEMAAMDHASMPGMDHMQMNHKSTMPEMNHAQMQHGTMSGMDHSKMQHGAMASMDHGQMQHGSMGGMDHSQMQHGTMSAMDHSQMQHGAPAASVVLSAPVTSSDIAKLSPSSTLRPDEFDGPKKEYR
jgi:uncharacterized protein involved in copper resistance